MGLPNILKAMRLLREQPGFRFTLDQVAYVRPFLERYPAEEADFRRFLAEGRLQLAGALDVMPDDNMPGGETFIRQMQYGKGYYRDKLGVDVTTGWLIDTFGHHAQMPQLLTQGGLQDILVRPRRAAAGFPLRVLLGGDRRHPDRRRSGLPHSYAHHVRLAQRHRQVQGVRSDAVQHALAQFAWAGPGRSRRGPTSPSRRSTLPPRVEEFNRDPKAPFAMRMAVPADFEAAIAGRTDRPVFKGELNPIFQGIYSSRIELKAWMRLDGAAVAHRREAERASPAWLGSPADLGGDLGRLGAGALQPDARPGLGRHDRPRL